MKFKNCALAIVAVFLPIAAFGEGDDAAALQNDDSQWVLPAKNYAGTRYSTLNKITPENVKNLKVAWSMSTGTNQGHEGAPLVVGSTMYIISSYPNILYAIDLAKD